MTPERSVVQLREMLDGAGVREGGALDASTAAAVWRVFKDFSTVPVEGMSREDDSDGLLFQTGMDDWGDEYGSHFSFSLVRQFSFDDDDGEYDHMEQLECLLRFDPAPDLQALGSEELWSFEQSLEEWWSAVEALPGFRAIVDSSHVPGSLEVRLEEV